MNKIDKSILRIYAHSIFMGIRSLSRFKFNIEVVKRILCPMDPSRYYELPAVVNFFDKIKKRKRVLDISSPKLLTFYLAENYKGSFFEGVDIQKKEIDAWKLGFANPINLNLKVVDGRKMKYADNSFDVVYSVSTIEHVHNTFNGNERGDTLLVKEVYRVLKKGGQFILTTMIADKSDILYKYNNIYGLEPKNRNSSKYFFARVYSKDDLINMFIKGTKFKVKHFEFSRYKFSLFEKMFNNLVPLSAIFGFLSILVMPRLINIKKGMSHRFGSRSDCVLVLQK